MDVRTTNTQDKKKTIVNLQKTNFRNKSPFCIVNVKVSHRHIPNRSSYQWRLNHLTFTHTILVHLCGGITMGMHWKMMAACEGSIAIFRYTWIMQMPLLGSLKSKIQQFTEQNKQTRITSNDATKLCVCDWGIVTLANTYGAHVWISTMTYSWCTILLLLSMQNGLGSESMLSPVCRSECECEPRAGPWLFGRKIWIHFYAIYLLRYSTYQSDEIGCEMHLQPMWWKHAILYALCKYLRWTSIVADTRWKAE